MIDNWWKTLLAQHISRKYIPCFPLNTIQIIKKKTPISLYDYRTFLHPLLFHYI